MTRPTQNPSPKQQPGTQKQKKASARTAKSPEDRQFTLLPTVSKPELLDENGTSDRDFRQFLYDFSCLANYLASARAYLASHLGVTSPQYNIMMIIAQYQGVQGVSVSDVAQHLHVTTAFITSEIRKLEREGLVEKHPNPSDGRGILLRLSKAGEESVQRIAPERLFVNDHLFRGLSGNDFRNLARTVASMIDDFARTVDMLDAMQRGGVTKLPIPE